MAPQLVNRTCDLLLWLGDIGQASADELAAGIDVPRPTVYRIARALENRGFVRRDPFTRKYALGYRLMQLSISGRSENLLSQVALPLMQGLTERWKETCHLVVREGAHATIVEHVDSPRSVRVSYPPGRRIPLAGGASAKVILAHLKDSELRAVMRELSDLNIPAVQVGDDLQLALRGIRVAGFAVTSGEVFPEVSAVAVPVLVDKRPAAALSLNFPTARFDTTILSDVVDDLRAAAADIGSDLQGRAFNSGGADEL